ncbi:hypothetical protein F941_02544 [Acinetobacter bouvetii DSM 14964 = CIP 107468]|jgi:MerR family copper efflux transcriptional regulator|uniref:HTH merR-type domain-containing protein n=1 Tax=Acinetobacter bouvetii DSM 14964 = CIP 107468 TaxID=1120925 RepID=N9DHM9_9GAMM|nr:MerR family transcriptional regulator [Acinetobacter bouvetii]ENV82099.1 hypothetical protein F941_02544 [Acinetobacter bouvetii DSM 14964 = CIP 107468]BCU63860.1 hypothetical protein ACBO_06510 [Acinetobacter bouvetii]
MLLSIGELAKKAGVSVRVVRYYNNQGLLHSQRGANGYRYFKEQTITQIQQIQRFIAFGFNLAEIRTFPDCMRLIEDAAFCPETQSLQKARLDKIEQQIIDLERKKLELLKSLAEEQ